MFVMHCGFNHRKQAVSAQRMSMCHSYLVLLTGTLALETFNAMADIFTAQHVALCRQSLQFHVHCAELR